MSVVKHSPAAIESRSFEAELAAHLPLLLAVATRFTRNKHRAQDLLQDTVLKVLRAKDSFELGSSFRRWSVTILTNTYFHSYRRERLERRALWGARLQDIRRATLGQGQKDGQSAEALLSERQLHDSVLAALGQLPEPFRLAVALCDLQGLSYREAAQILDCPMGTVMSRLHRGRRTLRKTLGEPTALLGGTLPAAWSQPAQPAAQAPSDVVAGQRALGPRRKRRVVA